MYSINSLLFSDDIRQGLFEFESTKLGFDLNFPHRSQTQIQNIICIGYDRIGLL
jgi:hypothetical protein